MMVLCRFLIIKLESIYEVLGLTILEQEALYLINYTEPLLPTLTIDLFIFQILKV
jgi:hypothetical protein